MIRSKEYLKAKFSAGNIPTEEDYKDLVDSLYGSIDHIKTSVDTVDWTKDEYLVTAKTIYGEFSETIELIQLLSQRVTAAEERITTFENRVTNSPDWESTVDIPDADAIRTFVQDYTDALVFEITEGCVYVD